MLYLSNSPFSSIPLFLLWYSKRARFTSTTSFFRGSYWGNGTPYVSIVPLLSIRGTIFGFAIAPTSFALALETNALVYIPQQALAAIYVQLYFAMLTSRDKWPPGVVLFVLQRVTCTLHVSPPRTVIVPSLKKSPSSFGIYALSLTIFGCIFSCYSMCSTIHPRWWQSWAIHWLWESF